MTTTPRLLTVGPSLGVSAIGLAGVDIGEPLNQADAVYRLLLDPGGGDYTQTLIADGAGAIWPNDDPFIIIDDGRGVQFGCLPAPANGATAANAIYRANREAKTGDASITVWDVEGSGDVYSLPLPLESFIEGPVMGPDGLLYFISRRGIDVQAWVTRTDLHQPNSPLTPGAESFGPPIVAANFKNIFITAGPPSHLVTIKSNETAAYVWNVPGPGFNQRLLTFDHVFSNPGREPPGIALGGAVGGSSVWAPVDEFFVGGQSVPSILIVNSPTTVTSQAIGGGRAGDTAQRLQNTNDKVLTFSGSVASFGSGDVAQWDQPPTLDTRFTTPDVSGELDMVHVFPDYAGETP